MSTIDRNGSQSLCLSPRWGFAKGVQFGFLGVESNLIPASAGVLPPFLLLHGTQQQNNEVRFLQHYKQTLALRLITELAGEFKTQFGRDSGGLLRTYMDVGPNRPWKLAERVTCPTLVIYGRKDPLVDPRSAHRVTKHFRNAHVVVLPDSGHVAQMEHPEFVAAAWERFIR